jgi:hypothetical protein
MDSGGKGAMILSSTTEQTSLLGLRVSAGLLVLLGCLWGFYALLFSVFFAVTGVRGWKGHFASPNSPRSLLTELFVVIIMSSLTWLCLKAAVALRDARRWAAYIAIAFGLLLLLFTASFVYDMYHPERQGPDEYFAILFVPVTLFIGLWWCIYLNLPHVGAHLKDRHSS